MLLSSGLIPNQPHTSMMSVIVTLGHASGGSDQSYVHTRHMDRFLQKMVRLLGPELLYTICCQP